MSNNIEKQKAQRRNYEKRRNIHKNNYKARYALETSANPDGTQTTRAIKLRKPLLSQIPGALPKSRKYSQAAKPKPLSAKELQNVAVNELYD